MTVKSPGLAVSPLPRYSCTSAFSRPTATGFFPGFALCSAPALDSAPADSATACIPSSTRMKRSLDIVYCECFLRQLGLSAKFDQRAHITRYRSQWLTNVCDLHAPDDAYRSNIRPNFALCPCPVRLMCRRPSGSRYPTAVAIRPWPYPQAASLAGNVIRNTTGRRLSRREGGPDTGA
jgi:hypothetical protein